MSDQEQSDQKRREALEKRAMSSAQAPQRGFGQVKYVDFEVVKWDNGAFVSANDDDPDGQLQITIGIETFKKDGGVYLAERKILDTQRGQNNWRDITLASLKKIGSTASGLVNKWVEYERRPTKRWNRDTRQVEDTGFDAFWFVQVFRSQEACEAAYVQSTGVRFNDDESAATNGSGNSAIEDSVRMLWTISGQDADKFKAEVSRNQFFMAHFKTAEAALEFVLKDEAETESVEDLPF